MWPWDHLAFGYLLFTAVRWLRRWKRPDDVAAGTLVVGTQLPDLIDKPLAWSAGVLPSGLSLGHSAVFALVATLVTAWVGRRFNRPRLGLILAIGLGSHLLGDVLYALFLGSSRPFAFVLWPFVPAEPEPAIGLLAAIAAAWTQFHGILGTPIGRVYLAVEVLLLATAAAVWARDGVPGTIAARRRLGRWLNSRDQHR